MSSPHIYHSALILAPRKSNLWGLYESHAHPFIRVVQGAPMSWDTNAATATRSPGIDRAVWSPCGRFIAITWDHARRVDILDPVAFQPLQTFGDGLYGSWIHVQIFSPDSHTLTCAGVFIESQEVLIVSWDLQTGGVVTAIKHSLQGPGSNIDVHTSNMPPAPPKYSASSITYSANGKMVGVLYSGTSSSKISIYDVVSGTHMHSHSLNGGNQPNDKIWTQGESLQFITVDVVTVVIWEVGFTSGAAPMEVERLTLPIHPIHREHRYIQLNPTTPSRYVLFLWNGVLVWDPHNSKPMLRCTDTRFQPEMSFSSDGCFFACLAAGSGIYLWKESPTGYILHGILESNTTHAPLLSPNGESIAAFSNHTIRLWHTKGFATTPPRTLTHTSQLTTDFLLDFSPDGVLAVVARKEDNKAIVLNPNSGVHWLTIDAGMAVYGLQVTRDTVIIVGGWRATAWNLPMGNNASDDRVDLKGGSWTINLHKSWPDRAIVLGASISPDFRQIALSAWSTAFGRLVYVYSTSTGVHLAHTTAFSNTPWFSPDGCSIWNIGDNGEPFVKAPSSERDWYKFIRYTMNCSEDYTEDGGEECGGDSDEVQAQEAIGQVGESFIPIEHPGEGYPWASSCGYQVTDDWWILDPDRKRLLMLPPPWRSYPLLRVWKGQFLALLHGGLLEPVILKLEAES